MIAYIQPSFGFPSDPIPVAYVVVILGNGKWFKLSEDARGNGLLIKHFEFGAKPTEAVETDNEQ